LQNKSLKYGVPVAVVDMLTMKLGGLVTAPAKKLAVESVGGSAGEAAGQLVSEGEITSPSEVLIEGIAELGVGGAQQSALSGINMLNDKQVQQDLKETQSKSDELRNAREKEVLDAYNAELEAQQTVDPELGPMTEVEGVTVTNIDANAGEILQEGSVPNKVVKELDATKFSDFNEVVFIDNDDHTMAGVTGIGRLVINVGKLKKHIKDNGLDADEYIQKLIQEEAIHDAHLKSILGEYDASTTEQSFSEFAAERFQRIANEMTDEQKAYVREVYGQDLEDASMGAEYVRMLVQERRHGSITESLLWNELGLKPAPATRNYFRRAFDFIRRRVKRDNVDPDTIQNEVNNLVGILQDIEDRSNDMGDVEINRAQAAETAESVQRQEQVELQRAEDAPTSAGMEQQAGIEEQRAATQTDPQMEQQAAVEQQRADAPVTDPEVARQEQIEMERAQRRDVTGVRQTQEPIGPTRPPVKLEWQSLEDILNEPLVVTGSPKVIPSSDVIDQRRTKQVEAGKLDQQPGFQRTAEQSVELEQKQFTEQQEQRGEAERVQPEPLRPPEGAFQEAQTTAEPTTETQQQPAQQEQVLTDEENQFVENISNAYAGKRFFNQTARVDAAASVSTDTKLQLLKMRQSGKLDEARFQQMARTIAANKARDIGRTQQRRAVETTVDENETGQTVFDREEATAPSPEQITRKRERLQRVSKAIDELPAAQREVMQLTAQGLSPAEIVEQTGKSRQAVDTNLSRARAKLMKQPDLMLEASTQGKRVPELIAAQQRFADSKKTLADRKLLADAIQQYKPIAPSVDIPTIESLLSSNDIINSLVEENKKLAAQKYFDEKVSGTPIREGQAIDVRIDIPAYNATGNYVVTMHNRGIGKVIGYDSFVHLVGGVDGKVEFVTRGKPENIRKIALGERKTPFAVVRGDFKSTESLPDLTGWVQVGFDPERHSYFYDRANPANRVISADEAVSIGNTVFVNGNVKMEPATAPELYASTQGKPDAAKAKSELRDVLNEVKELMKTAPFAVHNMPVEQAIRQVLDAQSPEQQRTLDAEVGVKTMDDVDRIFSPLEPDKPSMGERLRSAIESFSTNFLTRFAPLKQLESKVFKVMGKKAPRLDLARKFEQLAGSPARAEKMMMDFHNAVVKPIKGLEQQFNRLMFLRRTRQRLQDNPDRKRVADYSLSDVVKLIAEVEAKMSPQQMQQLESAIDQYQEFMAAILRMQMNSGRISQETLNNIVESNDFYAPFLVLKHLEDSESTSATGQRIDTTKQLAQMITGIDDTDFRLGNFIDAAYERILTGYMLADKNLKMQELYALSQIDESGLVRELKETKVGAKKTVREKADHEVSVFVDGEQKHLAVNREVARSIEGLNAQTTGMLAKAMAVTSKPMKAGATTWNLAFQFVNLFAADIPRLAMISKYGFRSPVDLVRLPLDYVYSLFSSFTGNFGRPNALYKDFLNSGAARSTMQRELTPSLFEAQIDESGLIRNKPNERKFEPSVKGLFALAGTIANSIEETSKLVGLKRGMRIEKLAGMTPEQQRERMGEIVAEVRNYAGSPDFGRQGALTRAGQLNLVFMYFNARIQGIAADLGRLVGRDGGKNAALAHARLAAAVGIPTVTLWALNNSDEFKEDYEEIPEKDKENYWHIPTDQFFVNDEGKRIRDYYRIPKREVSKLYANIVESSMKFLETREPKALKQMGVVFLENIMPVSVTGENMEERVESVFSSLNPLFKGPLEFGLNRNMWQHRDTVPEYLKAASPEQQYFNSTPQIFRTIAKEMPDALPESFRSPLMLKQLTGTMTAGLFTQFLPPRETNRKPLGVFSDQSPLFRRFIRSPYVNESETEKQLKAIERTEADRQLEERRAVDQFIEDTKGMSSINRMIRTRQASGGSRTLFQKYKKAIEDDSNLTTRLDKRVRGLSVSSGARSMFIMQQMEGMQYAGKVEYLRGLFQKRVISGQVAQQIFAETGISPSEYTR